MQFSISGVNNVSALSRLNIISRNEDFHLDAQCHILSSITGLLPIEYFQVKVWETHSNIFLADPDFNSPSGVDIFIGAQYYFSLLKPVQLTHKSYLTVIQQTRLAFIVSGQIPVNPKSRNSTQASFLVINVKTSDIIILENRRVN